MFTWINAAAFVGGLFVGAVLVFGVIFVAHAVVEKSRRAQESEWRRGNR